MRIGITRFWGTKLWAVILTAASSSQKGPKFTTKTKKKKINGLLCKSEWLVPIVKLLSSQKSHWSWPVYYADQYYLTVTLDTLSAPISLLVFSRVGTIFVLRLYSTLHSAVMHRGLKSLQQGCSSLRCGAISSPTGLERWWQGSSGN